MISVKNIDSIVLKFIKPLGAKIIDNSFWFQYGGRYSPSLDVIELNPTYCQECFLTSNIVVLHELIHWTGHSTRMSRFAIIAMQYNLGHELSSIQRDTEEMIANYGCLYLHEYLKLDCEGAKKTIEWYLGFISKDVDLEYCMAKARDAANYVHSQVELKKTG